MQTETYISTAAVARVAGHVALVALVVSTAIGAQLYRMGYERGAAQTVSLLLNMPDSPVAKPPKGG